MTQQDAELYEYGCEPQALLCMCPWLVHGLQACGSLDFALGLIPMIIVVLSFSFLSIPLSINV